MSNDVCVTSHSLAGASRFEPDYAPHVVKPTAIAIAAAAAIAASAPAAGSVAARGLLPEYAVLVSAVAGGIVAAKPIYTCRGPDLLAITEALNGPAEVRRIGTETVAQSLGSPKKPWPRNRRAFSNGGRAVKPDFVKGGSFYVVETGDRLELTSELRDLRAIARRRGGDVVVVTRKVTSLSPSLVTAAKEWWRQKTGRLRVARCI